MKKSEEQEQLDVQEMTEHIDDLIRMVESGKTFVIVRRGKPVAQLGPLSNPKIDEAERRRQKDIERWFADMDQLAEEIGKRWPKGVSSVEAVQDVRRDL